MSDCLKDHQQPCYCSFCQASRLLSGHPVLTEPGGVISDEVEALLINVAQILDAVKTDWAGAWSTFDQAQRDHITRLLVAKRPPTV